MERRDCIDVVAYEGPESSTSFLNCHVAHLHFMKQDEVTILAYRDFMLPQFEELASEKARDAMGA